MRLLVLGVVGTLAACKGGGGTVSDDLVVRESPAGDVESAEATNEGAPAPREGAEATREGAGGDSNGGAAQTSGSRNGSSNSSGGTTPSAGFRCGGTFSCATGSESQTATLTNVNGVCSATSANGTAVLGSDGTLSADGTAVGHWAASGSGFTFTIGNVITTCSPL